MVIILALPVPADIIKFIVSLDATGKSNVYGCEATNCIEPPIFSFTTLAPFVLLTYGIASDAPPEVSQT